MSEVALLLSFDSASAFCLQFDDACGGSTVLVGVVFFDLFILYFCLDIRACLQSVLAGFPLEI